MRIAVTGAHLTGKSTLIDALTAVLPTYQVVPEPYYQLAEEGYPFHRLPTLDDFEAQLQRSLANLDDSEPDTLFDRCPLDLLAYLACHPDTAGFDPGPWLPDLERALTTLDLIIYLPIESPDRIVLPDTAERACRAEVDDRLREMVVEGLVPAEKVLELRGSLTGRLEALAGRFGLSAS